VREEGSIDTMGSLFAIVAYSRDGGEARAAISDAFDEAARLDALLSNYKPHSEWSNINRLAAGHSVRLSTELFNLLTVCQTYSRESEGTFDISIGPLMKVWGFYEGAGHLADREQITRVLSSVGYRNIILDSKEHTVRFAKDGMELDPGGIGKGYAVDRMADILRRHGIHAALISAGGSSIYALGAPPGQTGWRVDLMASKNSSCAAAKVTLHDESLSTSGSYEKFFYADGKRWSHIMDPRTGKPSRGMLSVSVIAPQTIDSEAWAKPYYILGREWTAKHKKKGFRVFMCEDRAGATCGWVQ
jgi:thiamine biosynthesis lipoprotein